MPRKKSANADDFTIQDVLSLVNAQTGKVSHGGEMSVKCPQNPKNSFDVNLETGRFKCWKTCSGCPVYGKGGPVNLYRLFNPTLDFKGACAEIAKAKEVHSITQVVQYQAPPKVANAELAPIEERDRTYRALLSQLTLQPGHRKDLRERGLSDDQIREFGAKSIPTCGVLSIPKLLLQEGYTLQGVPLFGKENGRWRLCTVRGKTGFFIPYFDQKGRIQQLQIRYDVVAKEGMTDEMLHELKKDRYRWGTSAAYTNGCSASNIPFWGRMQHFKNEKTVVITEGGLKATVASYIGDMWVVAIPGVSCTQAFKDIILWCKEHGVRIVEAFDMDGKAIPGEKRVLHPFDAQGNSRYDKELVDEVKNRSGRFIAVGSDYGPRVVNENVVNAIRKLYEMAKEEGVHMIPWTWNPNYKGIDDYLLAQRSIGGNMRWDDSVAVNLTEDEDNLEDPTQEPAPPVVSPPAIQLQDQQPITAPIMPPILSLPGQVGNVTMPSIMPPVALPRQTRLPAAAAAAPAAPPVVMPPPVRPPVVSTDVPDMPANGQ